MAVNWESIKKQTAFYQASERSLEEKERQRLNHGKDLSRAMEEAREDSLRLYAEMLEEQQLDKQRMQMQQLQSIHPGALLGSGGLSNAALGGLPGYQSFFAKSSFVFPDRAVTKSMIEKLKQVEPRTAHKPMPDSITMITGYRAWRVSTTLDRQLCLEAVGQSTKWEPKQKIEAKCVKETISRRHPAPQRNCSCGVWAFKSMDMLPEALATQSFQSEVRVIGIVDLWGRVIETENGFRAQYAYPKELWLLEDGLEELGWIYGVKIRSFNQER